MNQKTKSILVVVALIILSVALIYALVNKFFTTRQESIEKNANILISYMFRAGTAGQLGARNERDVVEEFNVGDYFGISGKYQGRGDNAVEINLLERNGDLKREGIIASFIAHETSGGGSAFSACCAEVPGALGKYYIEILINKKRKNLLSFEVVEKEVIIEDVYDDDDFFEDEAGESDYEENDFDE